jgi:acyl-[acyl-carrier-protein]-phospholipid O-acyltransferase/long-chain-fatty-acid--[acyl-carrier-protein] ligase
MGIALLPVAVLAARGLARQTLTFILRVIVHLLYRLKVEGTENLPATGGYLLVSNHLSWIDGFLVGLTAPRHVRMVVYANYFQGWWVRWFGRVAGVIPIQPGKRSIIESLRAARQVLLDGQIAGIFPEGGISRSGQLQPFQPGFLKLLKGTHVPVVPMHLDGLWGSLFSFEGGKFFWKLPRRWRRPLRVRFGRPIYEPASVDEVRQAVAALGEQVGQAPRA